MFKQRLDYASEEDKIHNFGKFMEMFCVCARLYCKCTLDKLFIVVLPLHCAVPSDRVEVLGKFWGLAHHCPQEN